MVGKKELILDDLLRELRIDKEPIENENGSYTIDLEDSNEYAKYYTKLDKAEFLEVDDEASQSNNADVASIQFIPKEDEVMPSSLSNTDFVITLLGNFDTEEYKMIIRILD